MIIETSAIICLFILPSGFSHQMYDHGSVLRQQTLVC